MTQPRLGVVEARQRKVDSIVEALGQIPEDLSSLGRLEVLGVLHCVQVSIDAAMDLAAIAVRDQGLTVQDDHHNLDALVEAGVMQTTLAAQLRRLNGLRNAIVHKYNKFEETTVLEAVPEIQETLLSFVEALDGSPDE